MARNPETSRLILETTEKKDGNISKNYSITKLQEGDSIIVDMLNHTVSFKRNLIEDGRKFRIFLCEKGEECDHLWEPEEFQLQEKVNGKQLSEDEAKRIIQLVSVTTGLRIKGTITDNAKQTIKADF